MSKNKIKKEVTGNGLNENHPLVQKRRESLGLKETKSLKVSEDLLNEWRNHHCTDKELREAMQQIINSKK